MLGRNKSERNKLRRRRRPSPRPMSDAADGVDCPTPPSSVTASDTPTLLDQEKPELGEKESNTLPSNPRFKESTMDDPQAQVISSLRSQISDLISQVTQLNGKLVKSYDRVSDLEDELHITSSTLRSNSLKISHLELERTQHLAALDTGLLVEKSHVTAELTRLMERATDEAARRGQAEDARTNIEKELDDLSADLFTRANTMVAEARFGRAKSERKVVDAEMALQGAEEAVGLMQGQMQLLREEKERSADELARMKALMGKGKYVEHPPTLSTTSVKLLSLHSPYQEFLLFVAHLRIVRPSSAHPPPISTFLPLPFLARLQSEDSDPTVRLDFAPSLNWLSRRSVLSAIYSGQLTIEPISPTTLLLETTSSSLQSMIPGSHHGVSCALCGTPIFSPNPEYGHNAPPLHPLSSLSLSRHGTALTGSGTWSSSLFKNPLSNNMSAAPSPPLTPPPYIASQSNPNSPSTPHVVYVFRLAQTQAPNNSTQAQQKPTNYPLCGSGWCLTRLRATCSLWAFVRAGVIDRVWEEELPPPPSGWERSRTQNNSTISLSVSTSPASTPQKSQVEKDKAPPLPPRRRSKMSSVSASVGSLWGMASGALRSQPQSPKQTEKDKDGPTAEELPPNLELGRKAAPVGGLTVSVPPPLPRRSTDRGVSPGGVEVKAPKADEMSSSDSPSDAGKSDASEQTPVPQPERESRFPAGLQIGHSLSQASSAPSGTMDEFLTPVEELSSLPLPTVPSPSKTPAPTPPPTLPPRAPRSPIHAAPPLSPRLLPLPDSQPGTPLAGSFPRSRPTSMSAAPLQLQSLHGQLEDAKLPSRAASPVHTGPPPPVPRRAAARRVVPIPPDTAQPSDSAAPSPEKESPTERESSGDSAPPAEKVSSDEEKPETSVPDNEPKATPRVSEEAPRLPPPPPPRRIDHASKPSVPRMNGVVAETVSTSDYGDNDGKAEEKLAEHKVEVTNGTKPDAQDDAAHGPFVSEVTWEERTWKEIVRLREEMFWARVGAVRN